MLPSILTNYKKHLFSILFTLLLSLIPISKTFASITVSPSQQTITTTEKTSVKRKVTFKNDEKTTIYINPQVFSYKPKEKEFLTEEKDIFIKINNEILAVRAGESVTLEYEVVPTGSISQGTHLNLIMFQDAQKESKNTQYQVGISGKISHLVVLNIIGKNGFPKDFAYVNIEVMDSGIPFIKASKIKYTLHNTTDFIITPTGEIQIFNQKGGYRPIYNHINKAEKRLYPKESITETFEIKDWHIQDLLFPRNIVALFYNDINDKHHRVEIKQNINYIVIIFAITTITVIGIILRVIISNIHTNTTKKKAPEK